MCKARKVLQGHRDLRDRKARRVLRGRKGLWGREDRLARQGLPVPLVQQDPRVSRVRKASRDRPDQPVQVDLRAQKERRKRRTFTCVLCRAGM